MEAKIEWVTIQQEKYESILGEYKEYKEHIAIEVSKALDRTADKMRVFEKSIQEVAV